MERMDTNGFYFGYGLIQPSSHDAFASIYLDTLKHMLLLLLLLLFSAHVGVRTCVCTRVVRISESPCVRTEALIKGLERDSGGPCPALLSILASRLSSLLSVNIRFSSARLLHSPLSSLCPASTSLPACLPSCLPDCRWWALWELLNPPSKNLITLHLQPRRPEQRKKWSGKEESQVSVRIVY